MEPEASTHRQNYINTSLERNMVRFISLVSSFLALGLVSPLNASVTRSRLLHFSPTLVLLKQKVLIPAATLLSFVPGRQMSGPPVAARKSFFVPPDRDHLVFSLGKTAFSATWLLNGQGVDVRGPGFTELVLGGVCEHAGENSRY